MQLTEATMMAFAALEERAGVCREPKLIQFFIDVASFSMYRSPEGI